MEQHVYVLLIVVILKVALLIIGFCMMYFGTKGHGARGTGAVLFLIGGIGISLMAPPSWQARYQSFLLQKEVTAPNDNSTQVTFEGEVGEWTPSDYFELDANTIKLKKTPPKPWVAVYKQSSDKGYIREDTEVEDGDILVYFQQDPREKDFDDKDRKTSTPQKLR